MSSVFTIHPPEIASQKVTHAYSYTNGDQTLSFKEEHFFPIEIHDSKSLRALTIATSVSYFKLHLAEEIVVNWYLSEAEKDFWRWFFVHGFSELIYQNQLDWSLIENLTIKSTGEEVKVIEHHKNPFTKHAIVGIGGGKDSSLAVELMKKMGFPLAGFATKVREIKLIQENVNTLQIPLLEVRRTPDPQLLTLRENVFLGHIPISMLYALTGVVLAEEKRFSYVVVANETSADESNTLWQGKEVNHQWSKTSQFEKKLQDFIHTTIAPQITYFSILRPLGGFRVTNLFTKMCPHVFENFSSCNKNFTIEQNTTKKWCGECAKCLGTYILLSTSLPKRKAIEILGSDLYDNNNLEKLLKELLGLSPVKPFDCVATRDEMCLAISLIPEFRSTPLGKSLTDEEWGEILRVAELSRHWLTDYNQHYIPKEINQQLSDIINI